MGMFLKFNLKPLLKKSYLYQKKILNKAYISLVIILLHFSLYKEFLKNPLSKKTIHHCNFNLETAYTSILVNKIVYLSSTIILTRSNFRPLLFLIKTNQTNYKVTQLKLLKIFFFNLIKYWLNWIAKYRFIIDC